MRSSNRSFTVQMIGSVVFVIVFLLWLSLRAPFPGGLTNAMVAGGITGAIVAIGYAIRNRIHAARLGKVYGNDPR